MTRPSFARTISSSISMDDLEEYPYVTSAPMDEIIVQQLATLVDSTQRFVQNTLGLFLRSPFSFDSLYRLSIILLLFERLLRPLRKITSKTDFFNIEESRQKTIPIKEVDQIGLIMAISLAFLLTRSDEGDTRPQRSNSINQEFVIVMTVIFSIICLGSFLPMALWGLTSLLIFNTICWETTLLVLVLLWLSGVVWSGLEHFLTTNVVMHGTLSNY